METNSAFDGIGAGPVVACGAALGILLGVVGGESIDTTPLQHGPTFEQLVPGREPASPDMWVDAGANLPDRYPQDTRYGRVEVWELRSYILRRERRPEFAYLDPPPTEDTMPASADETPADSVPLAERPKLAVALVPGRLEQAALPIGDEAVLEAAGAHVARAYAISAQLKQGTMAWELDAP